MDDKTKNEFLSLFLQTARTHISTLRSRMATLQAGSLQPDAVEEVHRSAHSLKGECRAMGHQMTGNLSYLLELTFFGMKNGTINQTPQLFAAVTDAVNALEQSLSEIEKTGNEADLRGQMSLFEQKTGVTLPVENAK